MSDEVVIKAFVLDDDYKLEPNKINLAKSWPAINDELAKEVQLNMLSGQIDLIIGVDQLYNKISNSNIITHQKED